MITEMNVRAFEDLSKRIESEEGKRLAQNELKEFQEALKGVTKGSQDYLIKRNKILMADYVANYIWNICLGAAYKASCDIMEIYQHVATNLIRDIDNFDFDNDTLLITSYLFNAIKGYANDYAYEFLGDISYGKYAVFSKNNKDFIANKRFRTPKETEAKAKAVAYQQDKDVYYTDNSIDIEKENMYKRTVAKLLEDYNSIEQKILFNFIEGSKPRHLAEHFGVPVNKIYELVKKFKNEAKDSTALKEFLTYCEEKR